MKGACCCIIRTANETLDYTGVTITKYWSLRTSTPYQSDLKTSVYTLGTPITVLHSCLFLKPKLPWLLSELWDMIGNAVKCFIKIYACYTHRFPIACTTIFPEKVVHFTKDSLLFGHLCWVVFIICLPSGGLQITREHASKQPLLIVIIFIGRSKPITSANCQHTSLPMDWPLPALLGRTKTVATPLPSWFVLVHTEFWDLNLSLKVEEIKPKTWVFQLFSWFFYYTMFSFICWLSFPKLPFPANVPVKYLVTRCVHRQW